MRLKALAAVVVFCAAMFALFHEGDKRPNGLTREAQTIQKLKDLSPKAETRQEQAERIKNENKWKWSPGYRLHLRLRSSRPTKTRSKTPTPPPLVYFCSAALPQNWSILPPPNWSNFAPPLTENHRRRALTRLEKTIKPFLIRENLGRPSIAEDLNATGTRRLAVRLRK